jgi:predicted dehydrogenase
MVDCLMRVGILGTGWIAHEHALALSGLPGVAVVGVASSDPARAERFAAEHNIPLALGAYADLVQRDDLDVVHVCTRPVHHADLCEAGLRTNKHVVAEKPLAMSAQQTGHLVELARRTSWLVAGCNFNYRAYPAVQHARQLVADGELGELLFASGAYTQDWLLHPTDYNWRLDPAEEGIAGALGDIGTHWLDLVEHVSGRRVSELFAYLRTAVPERLDGDSGRRVSIQLDDCGVVSLRFDNGAVGTAAVSQVSAGRKNDAWFELNGSRGSLAWSQRDPDRLWIGRRDGPNATWERGPELTPEDVLPAGHPFGWRDAFRRNLHSMYVRMRGAEADPPVPFATFEDGHRSLRLLEAVVRSSREHQPIHVPAGVRDPETQGATSRRAPSP